MTMLTKFRPFFPEMLSRNDNQLDRMWRRFLDWESGNEVGFSPPVNVIEKPDRYLVKVELPGVKKEDIHVTLSDEMLSLRGEKREEKKEEKDNYHFSKTVFGAFERSLMLPLAAHDQDVDAKLDDGILTITVHKRKEALRREVKIK